MTAILLSAFLVITLVTAISMQHQINSLNKEIKEFYDVQKKQYAAFDELCTTVLVFMSIVKQAVADVTKAAEQPNNENDAAAAENSSNDEKQ